jgi:hypothetical protein
LQQGLVGNVSAKSLFFVGEFGVNDYTFIWMTNKTVPKVVRTIASAVEV